MIKKLHFIFILVLFSFTAGAQENWETLNPKPSFLTGLDIHFISGTEGFYITSNELFFTSDAGDTWELKEQLSGLADMAFNGTTGIIVGHGGNFLKSVDFGTTWSVGNVGISESLNTVTVFDSENMMVSGNNSVFITTDGGINWIQKNIPSSKVNKTFFVDMSIGHAVSDNGQIFKTVDGGDNWYVTADFTNYAPNSFFTVFFKNDTIGFATREHSILYKTIDGGESWQEAKQLGDAIYSFQFIDDSIGCGVGEYGVFKTIDGGDNWSRIGVDKDGYYSFSDMYGVYFFNENKGFAVGQRGRIAKTEDSGENWELYAPINKDVGQIDFLPNSNGIVRVSSDFFGSSNNGQDWEYLGTPNEGSYTEDFDFIDENIGYCIAGGSVGTSSSADKIYKTNDGGSTWVEPTNFGLSVDPGLYCLEFVNENLGFASGGFNRKRTFKTTDGGEIWRVVLQQAMGQIQFLNEDIGYARRVGFSTDIVYKTIDGGENWIEVFSSEEDINDFHFLDLRTGYLVGDQGLVYKTSDGGDTWQELHLPYGFYEEVEFFSKNVGYAVEDSGYIYKTQNGGHTWNQIHTSYGLTDLTFNNQGEIFIVGTFGKILKSQVTYDDVDLVVNEATGITATSANVQSIFAANAGSISNLRLEYGENGGFDESMPLNGTVEMGNSKSFHSEISGLKANTEYNFRAVATYNGNEHFSETKTFRTLENYSFVMNHVFNFSAETAELSATVLSNNAPISEISFEYGTDSEFLTENIPANPSTVLSSDGALNARASLIDLSSETEYYVRGKAVYDGEIIHTNTIRFVTRPDFSIFYYDPFISNSEVVLQAIVTANKGDLTEIVFEYGPESFGSQQEGFPNSIEMNRSDVVTTTLINLNMDDIYYYRIRAKLGEDVVYGPEAIFSLSEHSLLFNDQVEEIKRGSATVLGRVFTSTGYLANIQIEYGLDGQFDKSIFALPSFSGSGSTTLIQGQLMGLLSEKEYHYRIKATDSNGIDHYSEVGTFTTLEPLPQTNFSITTTGETCPDKKNGTLLIESEVASDYYLLFEEGWYTFNKDFLLENISPATYSITIAEIGGNTTYLYEFTIPQSQGLEARTTSTSNGLGKNVNVDINKGSLPFTVLINDKKFKEFNSNSFSFNADFGDEVVIASKYECEGTYSLKIGTGPSKDSYVNPVGSQALFSIVENNEKIGVQLFNVQGALLRSFEVMVENNTLSVDFENYPSGLYFIKISGVRERTHKILKK